VAAAGRPTAPRRELGSILRSLRKYERLTSDQVAERLGVSRSKVSRLENGQRGADKADIDRLCELYKVDKEQRLRLTVLAAESKQRARGPTSRLPYVDYLHLEAVATSISDFGLALVPGLLQTSDYARAVLRASVPPWDPQTIEDRVWARSARQERLYSKEAPTFDAVLDESVLHRVVGSPAVMVAQLRHLLAMSTLPTVTIRVLPFGAGAVPAGVNKFVMLRFTQPEIDDLVHLEDLSRERDLRNAKVVKTYVATFGALTRLSADPDLSQAMIEAKVIHYQSFEEGRNCPSQCSEPPPVQ
jgi:transcriptional regulator with XRE-family HTH domain